MFMTICSKIRRYLIVAASAAGALAAPAVSAEVLRVCADPDNLPFSKADGPERGMYLDLAELVGQRLGASVEYVWWLTHNQRRALRNTILQDGCDAYFALPAAAGYKLRGLQRSQPFLDVSYAVVAPPSFNVSSLADLKGKRVGVLHGSPPHILLTRQEGYTSSSFRIQGEALDALARGELDAAILWGPSAGYENMKRFQARWRVTPVSGEGLGGQMAVAVRSGKNSLLAGIDKALGGLQPDIVALSEKYGFPRSKPVPLVLAPAESRSAPGAQDSGRTSAPVSVTTAQERASTVAGPVAPGPVVAPAGGTPDSQAGRSRFNNACSHCHGTNAISAISERDLRRLTLRYKDNWRATAITTIKEGRSDAGMPPWKAVYNDQEIEEVLAFLATIQK